MLDRMGLAACALVLCAQTAPAQDAFVDFKSLTPEVALTAAQSAMTACRDAGYQVGVAVVDHAGRTQVYLRDRYAGMHVEETARRKALTAVSFRSPTSELATNTQAGTPTSAIRLIGEVLPLGGGLVIEAGDGARVGGIGVSGAPSPEADEVCAQAGIDAIEMEIAF